MSDLMDRAIALWRDALGGDREQDLERFRAVYADPVTVNGASLPVSELVDRAAAMQQAFDDVSYVVHDAVEGDGFLAVAFEIHGRHERPWSTVVGVLQPSHQDFVIPALDIFRLDDEGRVATIWATNDQTGLIAAALRPAG